MNRAALLAVILAVALAAMALVTAGSLNQAEALRRRHTPTMADQILNLENTERLAQGLRPLTVSSQLTASAELYARVLPLQGVTIEHIGPGGSVFWNRNAASGYAGWSAFEILAAGQPSAGAVVEAWRHSPGHWPIILDPGVRETGIAHVIVEGSIYRDYVVQEFGARP